MHISRALLTTTAVALLSPLPGMHGLAAAWVAPAGPRCSLVAVPAFSPEAGPDDYAGALAGGPLVAVGTTVTLRCSVQVGGSGLHPDPDATVASAGPATDTVTLPPTLVEFTNPSLPVYVCTQVRQVDQLNVTADLYWDETSQAWSTNAATSSCAAVVMPAAPVNGGIVVSYVPPTFIARAFGVLGNSSQWSCTVPPFNPLVPYVVSCTPVNTSIPWTCALVAVTAHAWNPGATARSSVDCNGDSVPEAQTATVSGPGGDGVLTTPGTPATSFDCRVDDGGNLGPVPSYLAVCIDPGPPVR